LVVAVARTPEGPTGVVFMPGRVEIDAEVPFARMDVIESPLGPQGRLEVLLDTSDTAGGSVRLMRVEHGALVTERDFGRLRKPCPSTPILTLLWVPLEGGVRDSLQPCDSP
jgi:hypothetical protein